MRIVPLAAAANQAFTVTIDQARWVLRFVDAGGVMVADISRNGVDLLRSFRVLSGEAIIPYHYLQIGNFIMLTGGNDLPTWEAFGVSQVLVYLSAAEMAIVPQPTVAEILAGQYEVAYLFTDEGFYITSDNGELLQNA